MDPYNANVTINRSYSLIGARLQKLAGNDFLYCEHNTVFAPDTNGCPSILYRLNGIFYLF